MKKLSKAAQNVQTKLVNIVMMDIAYIFDGKEALVKSKGEVKMDPCQVAARFTANFNATNEYKKFMKALAKKHTPIDATTFMATTTAGEMYTISARVINNEVEIAIMSF